VYLNGLEKDGGLKQFQDLQLDKQQDGRTQQQGSEHAEAKGEKILS
jgi:hypothetical protein